MSMLKRHLRENSSPLAWPTIFARPATQSNRRNKPFVLRGREVGTRSTTAASLLPTVVIAFVNSHAADLLLRP